MTVRGVVLVVVLAGCDGDKSTDDTIPPPTEGDTDTDADADSDTDADTDSDTDVDACAALSPGGDAIAVGEGEDLQTAVDAAPDGSTLALADGTWTLASPVVVDHPLTVMSASADAAAVTLDGEYVASNVFTVTSSDVTLAHLTLARSFDDLVAVVPPAGVSADRVVLRGLALVDPGHFGVSVIPDWASGGAADDGELACSSLLLTNTGREEIRGACETGGIDLLGVQGWWVRDNTMEGLWCDFGVSGPAIRAWRGSRAVTITRNSLLDVAYGIVIGETPDQLGRAYADEPCGTTDVLQAIEGVVTNNIVAAVDDDLLYSDGGVLTGLRAESSCDVTIAHNSIFAGEVPTASSLEARYATTTGLVANNLMSDKLVSTDSANVEMLGNVEQVQFDTWFWPAGDDFHTAPAALWAIDQGDPVTIGLVVDDVDGEPRDDGYPDVGADEL